MTPKQENDRYNKELLTKAYHDFDKKLNSYAFFKVHSRAVSDDLVQDTFIKTWKYLVKGGKIELMRAFLYHILNNLIIDEYRKRKTISLDSLVEKGFEPATDKTDGLVNILDGRAMFLLIKQLPEKYQKVMRMRYVQNLSIEEMSLITKQSKNAIAVQLHRGLKKLRFLYDHRA